MGVQITFQEAACEWFAQKAPSLTEGSYEDYETILVRYLYPSLGDYPMESMTEKEIDGAVQKIAEKSEKEETESGGLKKRRLLTIRRIAKSVVRYYEQKNAQSIPAWKREDKEDDRGDASPLAEDELQRVLLCVKNHHSREMLAVLLVLYCGIWRGEICALDCDDIHLDRREIYIHRSVHRVRNREGEQSTSPKNARTQCVVREISREGQKRWVEIPKELMGYVREFYQPGVFLMTGVKEKPMDLRTIKNRVDRIFESCGIKHISFQRLHKTYAVGKSDKRWLEELFPDKMGILEKNAIDMEKLIEGMAENLQELRICTGISEEDISGLLDLSLSAYKKIEERELKMTWLQYLAFLSVFRNCQEGRDFIDEKGLMTDSLKRIVR